LLTFLLRSWIEFLTSFRCSILFVIVNYV
jgi:hypothetical protein